MTVKPTGYGFDLHSRRRNIHLNLYFHFFALVSRQSAALCSATQHAMLPESGRKWGTECLNTRFPLPIYLLFHFNNKVVIVRCLHVRYKRKYMPNSIYVFLGIRTPKKGQYYTRPKQINAKFHFNNVM